MDQEENQKKGNEEINLDNDMEAPTVSTAVLESKSARISAWPINNRLGFWLRDKFEWAKQEWRLICELAVLILMILVVWGLLSLPVIFYYTTTNEVCQLHLPIIMLWIS